MRANLKAPQFLKIERYAQRLSHRVCTGDGGSELLASIILVSEEYNFIHYKWLRPVTEWGNKRPTSSGHQFHDDRDSIQHQFRQFGSTAKDRRRKNIWITDKIVYTTKLSGSKVFEFKVPTLNSGFKVSGDMTKPRAVFISDSSTWV